VARSLPWQHRKSIFSVALIDSAQPRSDGHVQRASSGGVLSLTGHLLAGYCVGANYGPIFRRLWTKVHQITSADAGEIVVCNAVFRLSISRSVPEIFAIEVRSRPKSRQKHVFGPPIFWVGGSPNFGLVFKIASISDHVAKFRGDRPRDRGDLALNKTRKPSCR